MKIRRLCSYPMLATVAMYPLSACSEAPRWAGRVEMREGVEVTSNPSVPLFDEALGLVSELWVLQGSSWMDPSRVHVESGLITVVDPPANQVHLVSSEGEARASIGRQGGGPGEFLRLVDAFPQADRLVVIDAGKSSIEYLDFDGEFQSSIHLNGQPWDGFPLNPGGLLVKGEFSSDPAAESYGDWVRVEEDGEPRAFTAVPLDPLPEEQGVQCSDLSPWAGGAARLRFTTPQIQVFDAAGRLEREIRIDMPVEVISDSEREAALSNLRRSLADRGLPPEFMEQSLIVMEERWRVKCRFGHLRADPSGGYAVFLEQNPDEFGSGSATLHFLSQGGVYLAKAFLPDAWRDFTIDKGVIYALARDPVTDLISLKAYGVNLPETVFVEASADLEEARQRGAGPS